MSESPPEHLPTVLLVDDDAVLRGRLALAFSRRGFEVREAGDRDAAVASAGDDSPEYAVVDLRLPGEGGLEVVRALHGIDPETRIVVLTGYGSIATALEAVRRGAVHYLQKPADLDELLAAFERGAAPATGPLPVPALDAETPSLARAEWEHIQRVLADVDGNISEAARRLGIHRRSLQRKLQKYPPRR